MDLLHIGSHLRVAARVAGVRRLDHLSPSARRSGLHLHLLPRATSDSVRRVRFLPRLQHQLAADLGPRVHGDRAGLRRPDVLHSLHLSRGVAAKAKRLRSRDGGGGDEEGGLDDTSVRAERTRAVRELGQRRSHVQLRRGAKGMRW